MAEPPRTFSPTAIWWWSGERLHRTRLRDQLERFADGGVFNLVLLNLAPSGPLYGSDADDPPFLSEEWWTLLDGVCEDAHELGVSLWFYDQLGFSGADIQACLVDEQPAYAGRRLERVRVVVDSDGDGGDGCDGRGRGDDGPRWPAYGLPVAAHAEPVDQNDRPTGPAVPLDVDGDSVRPAGVVRAPGPGRWWLTLHHHVARGFDYLGADACAALLDRVHGEFERRLGGRLGKVVAGSFQDELPALPSWSTGFADAFLRSRGYDLTECLDALYDDSAHPDTQRIRRDYHLTRAELAEEAFFRPLAAWHDRHGLLVGCDQQDPARAGHPVAGVELYADYARTHRWFSAPGSDHHGDARIHSSLAHLYGRPRTWIEAFHSTGWGGTLEETFDWLLPWLRAGATLYNPHAVYYTTKGGWWEWAPPGTDWRQPYWRHHRVFADAVARLCAILSLGSHLCDIAILLPTTTAQAGTALDGVSAQAERAQATYLELVGDMAWFRTRAGAVDRLGHDADVIDDASLVRAELRVADGEVRLCVAEEGYRTVVLPACTVLEEDTARRLVEFASAGGTLIAIAALPDHVIGPGAGAALDDLRACFTDGRAVFVPTTDDLTDLTDGLDAVLDEPHPVVRAPVPALARRVDEATVVFLTAATPRATRAAVTAPEGRGAAQGWIDARYDFDPGRYARTARVRVRDVAGPALLLDPFGGAFRTLPSWRAEDDVRAVEVDVPFDAGPAAVLVFPERAPSPTTGTPAAETAVRVPPASGTGPVGVTVGIPPDADWDMTLIPTLDDTWGDFGRPATGPPTGPAVTERRTFRHRVEGPGEDGVLDGWAVPGRVDDRPGPPVHATFGPRAIVLGSDGEVRSAPEWSDSRGIHKDPIHRDVLGPKGHVPEEFVHIGPTDGGTVARVRLDLLLDVAFDGYLAVGAPAAKTARLGGAPVEWDDGGHLAMGPVRLDAGRHLLELDLTPGQDCDLRAHVALVYDPERYRRPEWILPAGPREDGGRVTVGTTLPLTAIPARAVAQVAAPGLCVVRVNGHVVGRQGGFEPYAEHVVSRVRRHDIVAALRVGDNDITVETADAADSAVQVDAVFSGADGERDGRTVTVHSDGTWWAERAGERVPVVVRREQVGDPAALYLRRRPHPLPGAAWLDPGADDGTVLPVGFAVPGERTPVEWLWWELPPGTSQLTVDVHGETTVFIDGHERRATTAPGSGGAHSVTVDLSADGPAGPRTAALRVETRPGHEGGAALAGPVRCSVGRGLIRTGDWESHGLAEYSGGVRYRRQVTLPAEAATGRVSLDLGRVRGTAEVSVGGVAAGVRVCSPYVFDVTGLAGPGANTVEITVFGTLAPHLDAASPTHFIFPGQRVTGLMGPVRLHILQGGPRK